MKNTKVKYTIAQKLELKRYKNIFKEDKKYEALYEIINNALDAKSEKKISVQEVAQRINYPAYKINYWLKRYQEEGILAIIDYENVVIQYLKQCGKPISEWTKYDLWYQLYKVGITIESEKFIIPRSETFFWNILNKMKNWPDIDYTDTINEIYAKRKDRDHQILYVDYLSYPRNPMQPFADDTYYYIIISNNIFELIPITVKKGDNKWLKSQVKGFSKIIEYFESPEYENAIIILNDTEINRVIAVVFSNHKRKVLVVTRNGDNLENGLQEGLKYLNSIKIKLEEDMKVLERATNRYSFIEKNRKKYEEIKEI